MDRASRVGIAFLVLGLFGLAAGVVWSEVPESPDLRAAERKLAAARAELEEIVGSDLLGSAAPPLPSGEELEAGLSADDRDRASRLLDGDPEDWTAADREWIDGLLPLDLRLRAALRGEGEEAGEPEERLARMLPILRASRLLALRDRLALLGGEAAAFADGLALREDVAERLMLQGDLLGPLLGGAIHQEVLRDVRLAVGRPETPRAVLERIDGLLLRWRLAVPDPAAVVALEGLSLVERIDESPGRVGGEDPLDPLFLAPMARTFADLARTCRERGCSHAVEVLESPSEGGEDPYRSTTDLLMPNVLSAVWRMDWSVELTGAARVAIALRLEAWELGAYPRSLDDLPPGVAIEDGGTRDLALEYEPPARGRAGSGHPPEAGARLRFASEEALSRWPESRRSRVRPMLVWELPPPPAGPEPR